MTEENNKRKLVKVTFEFNDGLINWIEGEDAITWQEYINIGLRASIVNTSINTPPIYKIQSNRPEELNK